MDHTPNALFSSTSRPDDKCSPCSKLVKEAGQTGEQTLLAHTPQTLVTVVSLCVQSVSLSHVMAQPPTDMAIKQKQSCKLSITQRWAYSVSKTVKENGTVRTTVTWIFWRTAIDSETDITSYWEMADTVSDNMSSFKQGKRNVAVAAASKPVVRKVVLDLRYGKNSLFALTDSIVLEYRLTEGEVILWLPFKPGDTGPVLDRVHRWPAVDPLRLADDTDRIKQRIESFVESSCYRAYRLAGR